MPDSFFLFMATSEKLSPKDRIKFIVYFSMVTIMHFLVTAVVILFVLSTLNILNQNVLYIGELKYVEIIISLSIALVSGTVYFKSLNRLSSFVRDTMIKKRPF